MTFVDIFFPVEEDRDRFKALQSDFRDHGEKFCASGAESAVYI
jgi:hypothetical protein